MRRSYLDYAMSVIVSRALPDARDGLKPVHRRILFAMNESGYTADKPYRKSARVVGDVMGKYHPHGDASIYDALVRMAQSFSMRVPLIDGQGNFGSIDGDPPAAMRYTESRMAKAAALLLTDIDKETVDFSPSYDESNDEPRVLPASYPVLLINGANGIAVGMATNIPPHNPSEIIDAALLLIADPEATLDRLMEIARSTYYDAPAARAGVELLAAIVAICDEFEFYGWRRVQAALRHQGVVANHKRIKRLMREHDLQPRRRRRYVATTDSDHDQPIFSDRARELTPDGPDQLWVADLTYVAITGGFAYVAIILDA